MRRDPNDQTWMTHDAPKPAPRQPKPGEVLFRMRDEQGKIQHCELRDDRRLSGRRDLQFFENGELLFSRMASSETEARMIAEMAKKDYLRTGWTEIEKGGD